MSDARGANKSSSRRGEDEPTLPSRARDDSDLGWNERDDDGARDDDWYLRERPPHHDADR